jgi:hypothetical protein
MCISVVIVGVFINMRKSIAIIDFMMESVVPALYEDKRAP